MNPPIAKNPPTWVVMMAWLVVVLPLAWGVIQSVNNVLPLFR